MRNRSRVCVWRILAAGLACTAAALAQDGTLKIGDDAPAWRNQHIADWSESDARLVLADSPWVKTTTAVLQAQQENGRGGGGMGRGGGMGGGGMGGGGMGRGGGGMGMGGIGVSLPGMGGMGGGRNRGGGYPGSDPGGRTGSSDGYGGEPPKVTLRWESAMPVRAAELKIHDADAPTLDDKHYAIAVYGIPRRLVNTQTKDLADQLKKKAALKRDGKKDLKPSSVEVLDRPDGPVIVYLFPNSNEIARADRRVEFDGQIGRAKVSQSFYIDDMVWEGKLQL